MPRNPSRRDQHGVEADVLYGINRIGGKPRLRGCDNARPLTVGDRPGRVVELLARFNLDEDQELAPACHDVDLADRRAVAPREDAEALGDEESSRTAFRGYTGAERDLPFRLRRTWRQWAGA